jgi:D-arabinose 5-phosphate isomerase GutQ
MAVSSERLARMKATLEKESRILLELARQCDEGLASIVDILMETRGHVFVGGAGTSNPVAQRFAHLLSCCGRPSVFLHPADCLHGSSGAVKPEDTVVLISKGGCTVEINQFARIVKQRGGKVVALTENPDSELGQIADAIIKVKVTSDSDPFGMVATASSLANAAMTDAICETILVESGCTLESFAATHPGGAVGKKIESGQFLK